MKRSFLVMLLATGAAGFAAQAPAADPWKRVPALATSCLADDFTATIGRLHEATKEELAKQKEKNDEVELKFGKMDMTEKMARCVHSWRRIHRKP